MKKIIEKIDTILDIFSYPDKNILTNIKNKSPYLKDIIEKYNNIQELETEFVKLFISNFDNNIIPPYGAYYQNSSNKVEFLENLSKIYSSFGLEIKKDYKERIDHIVTILDFLAFLIEEQFDKKLIDEFIKNYVLWISEFAEKLEQSTNCELYLAGAALIKELFGELNEFKKS